MTAARRIAGLILLAGLAGCSSPPPPGVPAPAGPAPASSRLPARPGELPLDGLDPCALLTPAQLRSLGMQPRPVGAEWDSDALGSPGCMWESDGGWATRGDQGHLARLITRRGADHYLDNQKPVQVIDIDGWAAVQTTSPIAPSDQDHCLVLVDVAAGQTLWTQYDALLGDNPGITQEVSCARARDGARAMLATLKALPRTAN